MNVYTINVQVQRHTKYIYTRYEIDICTRLLETRQRVCWQTFELYTNPNCTILSLANYSPGRKLHLTCFHTYNIIVRTSFSSENGSIASRSQSKSSWSFDWTIDLRTLAIETHVWLLFGTGGRSFYGNHRSRELGYVYVYVLRTYTYVYTYNYNIARIKCSRCSTGMAKSSGKPGNYLLFQLSHLWSIGCIHVSMSHLIF